MAEDFERKLREDLGRLARGDKPRRTFEETAARFVREHLPSLLANSQRRYVTSIGQLRPHLQGKYIDEIDKVVVADIVSARKAQAVSGATINRDLACLSSILSSAVEWGWIDANVMLTIRKKGLKETQRVRFLTKAEFAQLCEVAAPHLVPMVIVAVETGLRFEEQLSLTWKQLDIKRREIRLPVTKNHEPRVVPLSPAALAQITAQPRHFKEEWVFWHGNGQRYVRLTRSLNTALRRAGITDFTWHDLRHTFATWAVRGDHDWLEQPMDLYRLQRWLGHKSAAMTQRYAHLQTDDLHALVKEPPGTKAGTRSED